MSRANAVVYVPVSSAAGGLTLKTLTYVESVGRWISAKIVSIRPDDIRRRARALLRAGITTLPAAELQGRSGAAVLLGLAEIREGFEAEITAQRRAGPAAGAARRTAATRPAPARRHNFAFGSEDSGEEDIDAARVRIAGGSGGLNTAGRGRNPQQRRGARGAPADEDMHEYFNEQLRSGGGIETEFADA